MLAISHSASFGDSSWGATTAPITVTPSSALTSGAKAAAVTGGVAVVGGLLTMMVMLMKNR